MYSFCEFWQMYIAMCPLPQLRCGKVLSPPKMPLVLCSQLFSPPPALSNHGCVICPCSFVFDERMLYNWYLRVCSSLSLASFIRKMHLKFIHIVSWISSFLFIGESYSIVELYHNLFICFPTEGYLGCFHFIVTTNKAAKKHSHTSYWMNVGFHFFENSSCCKSWPTLNIINEILYF